MHLSDLDVTPFSDNSIGWIIESSDEVLLKRKNWSDYQPTEIGTELYPGDLLQPAATAKVLVQCANGSTIWRVPAGMISGAANGCPPAVKAIPGRQSKIISPRGGTNSLIPYIISPRRTFLLNALPILRWNAVPGATHYRVSVIDESEDDVLWETQVNASEVVYPGEPLLAMGVDYSFIVEADTGTSSLQEEMPDLGFRRLDKAQAKSVLSVLEQPAHRELTQEAQALAKAYLYIGYELRTEAIETLEAWVKQDSQTAAVYRTLGELYQEVGLHRLAETHYLRAFKLASFDIEGQAVIAARLGEVYQALGNSEAARRWFIQARDGYVVLGDSQWVSELEKRQVQLNL
ncbi:tetratricopeptide repeat protein [Coleofasciculus sp. E2-BRE-01]|uniref:tetratricopeptide repeat protein n=1 Tax=Coleofasciculus sp. E2-BRE-01 TaxID=3069524 RepID=UPI0032F3996F